ncbi:MULTISPECIES: ABC transporter permease subunit [Acidiphilium]|uniref:Amino acid/amide ABC transporter membrane protein 1, HAAT family n=1 Tax=Acidiphilium rubrum TaxID=526 RepID=A0A8G2CK58_ACIRU|nr:MULTISPECIES: branched-chain amino acid ABC transporter permease [Acidiphilium]MBW4036461.1 branched-chain amino acid ABC transporter permease [Pseudomonadota bacterium]SIQ69692.1 amino acid/amide ABC transporter membrane protein 1, HAAT family [Acidiphilium rubrum]
MALLGLILFNIINGIAVLVLISIGLAVIYGMMRIINLAHGEFLMLGAYATVLSTNAGVNLWVSILIVSPIVVGLFGLLVERCIIRFLYGRLIDTMLATWGLSLFMIGGITTLFGTTVEGVSAPLGAFNIGPYHASLYSVFSIAVAAAMLGGVWSVLRFTKFGLIVRATMQNPPMAAALGVAPNRIYMLTFALGAALTGLAGGVLAPVAGVAPGMGAAYIAKAFITVIGGGAAIVTGSGLASALFGTIDQIVTFQTTPVIGQVALLIAAIIMIRILPQGITGRFFRRSL